MIFQRWGCTWSASACQPVMDPIDARPCSDGPVPASVCMQAAAPSWTSPAAVQHAAKNQA